MRKMFRKFIFLFGTCSSMFQPKGSSSVEAVTNIALDKPVTLSSQYNDMTAGSEAVDGVKTGLWADGCASTNFETNPSMILDLEAEHSISSVVLYNRVNCCRYACQSNIASGKDVSLSTQYNDDSAGSNAVNGIKTGQWADGCASTLQQSEPWLEIDFGSQFSISSIVLYNRIDCSICPGRLREVHIEVSTDGIDYDEIVYQSEAIGTSKTFLLSAPHPSGRFLKIWLGVTEYLTLCEVEVFGDGDIDGGWSDYGEWTECTRSCGPGTQSRSRTCTNPPPSGEGAPCDGEATEIRMCYTLDCPCDCQDYFAMGYTESGIYTIYPSKAFDGYEVYCDMDTDGGGWTVFQRREDGTVEFYLDWEDYKRGFGNPNEEHWLGNEKLRNIVKQGPYKLRIDLEDFEGGTRYAQYEIFEIGTAAESYKLRAEWYTGDPGIDSLSYHSGQPFSTKDRDSSAAGNCAARFKGAWWYFSCHHSNLNGLYLNGQHATYADGIEWFHWTGYYYSLKKTEMKTKRN